MITEEEMEAADIDGLLEALAAAGNTALLTQIVAARTQVVAQVGLLHQLGQWYNHRFCFQCIS